MGGEGKKEIRSDHAWIQINMISMMMCDVFPYACCMHARMRDERVLGMDGGDDDVVVVVIDDASFSHYGSSPQQTKCSRPCCTGDPVTLERNNKEEGVWNMPGRYVGVVCCVNDNNN